MRQIQREYMTSKRDDESEGRYGTVEIDDQGRLTLPEALREELHLDGGTEFEVVREGGDIRLVRHLPELETLALNEEWRDEAFRDAGDATFGDIVEKTRDDLDDALRERAESRGTRF